MQHDHREDQPEADTIRALLPGYAMGIATEEEAKQVEAALQARPELHEELADYQQMMDVLLVGTTPIQPPARAFDAVMRAITPQSRWQKLWSAIATPRWMVSPALVAAALVIVLGIIGALVVQVNTLQSQQIRLLENAQEQEIALALMRSQDVRWWKMPDPEAGQQGDPFAWLVYSPGEQSGVILASSFPDLPDDMAYQLWVSRGEERYSLGLFDVREDGSGAIVFQLPDALINFEGMGITPEPEGGSPGPTNPPVVRIDLERLW